MADDTNDKPTPASAPEPERAEKVSLDDLLVVIQDGVEKRCTVKQVMIHALDVISHHI